MESEPEQVILMPGKGPKGQKKGGKGMERRKEERAEVENTKSSDFVDRVDEIEGCGGWKKRLKMKKIGAKFGPKEAHGGAKKGRREKGGG